MVASAAWSRWNASIARRSRSRIVSLLAITNVFSLVAAKKLAQSVERAAGAEQNRLGRIRDAKSELRSVAESALNYGRQMMDVDRDLGDAGAPEHRERIVDQRPAAELEHRLWRHVSQRAKPLAHPGREHQRLHGISAA